MPAGTALQGGEPGATELVRGPQGCSSSVAMWQRFKGWRLLSSGKYLIKFFSLFFFPSYTYIAPDRIWVWGQQARRTQRKKRNVKGWGLGVSMEGLEEIDTVRLTNEVP